MIICKIMVAEELGQENEIILSKIFQGNELRKWAKIVSKKVEKCKTKKVYPWPGYQKDVPGRVDGWMVGWR